MDERATTVFERSPASPRSHVRLLAEPGRWASFRHLIDLLAVLLGTAGTLVLAGAQRANGPVPAVAFALCALILISSRHTRGKQLAERIPDACAAAVAACAVAAMTAIALGTLSGQRGFDLLVLRQWLITASLLCASRTGLGLIESRARSRGHLLTRTLIVGAGSVGSRVARRLASQPALGLQPIGFLDSDPTPVLKDADEQDLPVLGAPADAVKIAHETGTRQLIFAFSWERDDHLVEVVRRCQSAGLEVAVVPRMYEAINERATVDHLGGLPLMSFRRIDPHGWRFRAKYGVERVFALLSLIALAPLLLAIALAIAISSRGPVIYRQRRVGRGGREFDLLKFRSMTVEDERSEWDPVQGTAPGGVEGTDRRTRLGRWLRNTSLDELPQLINVLRGEMSLIGPRPERPEYTGRFALEIPGYEDRHRVKPGITGWAQVNGLRGQTSIADRVEWDNHYIDNWSLRLELRTLALTLGAVFSFREDEPQAVVGGDVGVDPDGAPTPGRREGIPEPARPALTVLSGVADPGTQWFCGYCGAPAGGPPPPLSRVCGACAEGLLLEAPADAAPRTGDAFLVADARLTVQAVSRRAEELLGVKEGDVIDHPVSELIADADSELGRPESFATAIAESALSDESGWSALVRPREAFGIRIRARVSHCGPPRAALIVLEPALAPAPRLRLVGAERPQAQGDSLPPPA